MALTQIFTGMEQGPEKINDNFNILNGERIITMDAQPYTGFVLSNGATWYGEKGSLVTAELPNGYRIVTIECVLKLASYTAAKSKPIVTLPTKYAPAHELPIEMPCSGSLITKWVLRSNGTIQIEGANDEKALNSNTWYPFNATYITHN